MNQKANIAIAVIAVILALIILVIYLVNIATRECNNNKDCPSTAYCGTDYTCHEFPHQVIVKETNFIPAAIIIGMALIIAAYIFKRRNVPLTKKE